MRHPLRAPPACSGRSGGRSASPSRSSPGSCTWPPWRSRRSRWSRRSSPGASSSWPCSPTAGSASSSAAASGRRRPHGARPRVPRPDGRDAAPPARTRLLDLRDDRLRGRDDHARGALPAVPPRRARCGTSTASARRRGGHPVRSLRRRDQGAHRAPFPATSSRSSAHGPGVAIARLDRGLLRLRARPADRRGRLGDRPHLGGRERLRDPRRDPRVRRPARRRRARDRRPRRCVRARDRRRRR